ncbi:conserved exported hypothetical protein [Bradyrhizobium sp. ORS 375]|uniref:hypothetical protein n=1 Tax=Bradyrhizobium sp. (strain ORS 375) TaxID=566679 RepID=UPI000240753E|nr:hypothetical protein [Bradyrhizobium sp. ORS 375]CCD95686.1 conserved exported hypothetical protein [Bradyrhizobium sp. ORS 375]
MTKTFNLLRAAALTVVAAATLSTVASRTSFAFSAEAQQMCTGDAFRLCSSEIPNIPAITACMIKNRSSLSSGCRTVLDKEVLKRGGKVAEAGDAN